MAPARAALSRVVVVVIGAALALFVLNVSVGHAGSNDLRFGIHVIDGSKTAELDRMQQAGANVIRTNFLWSAVQPTRGSEFRWHRYDALVTDATARGLPLLPILIGSPGFAAEEEAYPPKSKKDLRAFRDFTAAVVNRYGRDGDFWHEPGSESLPYRPLKEWQVWNEPNLRHFWDENPEGHEYAEFLKLTSKAIRSADKRAKVVLAGMTQSRRGLPKYLDDFYRLRHVKEYFDVAAVHPYGETVSDVKAGVERTRKTFDEHGDEKTPLWITEVGWGAGGPARIYTTTPAGQARNLRKVFAFVEANRSKLRLGTVVWFNTRDLKPREDEVGTWWQHSGLFWSDGSPKPAWETFVGFAGGVTGTGKIEEK